jgi:hypothetical protein
VGDEADEADEADERSSARVGRRDQAPIDPEGVDHHVLRPPDGGVPGADVVDADADPELLRGLQVGERRRLVEQHRLGDLHDQSLGRESRAGQGMSDVADDLRTHDAPSGPIPADPTGREPRGSPRAWR